MSYCERFTEVHYPLGRIDPVADGTLVTPWVSLSNYHRAVVIVWTGNLTGTLDCQLWQAQDAAGTGAQIIGGKAITQLTAADDGVLVAIELQTEELDVDNAFYCIQAVTVSGGQRDTYGVLILGLEPRCAPTPVVNWDEVVP